MDSALFQQEQMHIIKYELLDFPYVYVHIYQLQFNACRYLDNTTDTLRPYHSVHTDQTIYTRCFQNTMYIDIGKYMSIQNTCHDKTIICIESIFLYSITII